VSEVVHYCVTNMPGAVGRTSTFALCNVTLPWAMKIAELGILKAAQFLPPIAAAINIHDGEVTNRAVAETFDLTYSARFDAAS
jgi:alanine dehydrogenase